MRWRSKRVEEFRILRPWWWHLRPFGCRVGLHFMARWHAGDAYTCACGRNQLFAEEIRSVGDE